jgi:glycosyltransferase involved in cell wall biosynthesis
MRDVLARFEPDVVHIHNLYPLFSPSVLGVCRAAGTPVVMTVHNYRLACPIAVHFVRGEICTRCRGNREYHCFLNNCRGSRQESLAYAARHWTATRMGWFKRNVTRYAAISQYLKDYLIEEGYPAERIDVVSNMIAIPDSTSDAGAGGYVAFCGRLSEEKGIPTLIEAARRLPEVAVRIAGTGELLDTLKHEAPDNVEFIGMMDKPALARFYRGARCVVVPSVWCETFGLVAAEAMSHGIPPIVSRIGGLQTLIEDGVSGLHFTPGDAADLAEKIQRVWENPPLAGALGAAARHRAEMEYSEKVYFQRLMAVYEKAIGAGR